MFTDILLALFVQFIEHISLVVILFSIENELRIATILYYLKCRPSSFFIQYLL